MGTLERSGFYLITGGAGFIGTHLAERLLGLGKHVVLLDNLSRAGVELNVRRLRPPLLFASTNKVYGALADIGLKKSETHYVPKDPELSDRGIDEARPLDFHSPHGCSKGAADQYVLDYARTFGLRVVRMSSVYGPLQFGTEDHGWVAHFLIRATGKGS